jgi:hypothetical protein
MNFIKRYFKKIREKETKDLENQKIILTRRMNQIIEEMLSTKCAIHNFENCSIECTHFNPGLVFLINGIGYASKNPSCKLWK